MKTLKTTTIVAGILVAVISFSAHAADKNSTKRPAPEKQMILENMGISKALETRLITEYLRNLESPEAVGQEKQVKIYNTADELVYEGDPGTEKASALKIKADLLMEHDNILYYMLHK